MVEREAPKRKIENLEVTLIQLLTNWRPESLKAFVEKAVVELSIPEKEIINCILKMHMEGKIEFKPQKKTTLQNSSNYWWRKGLNWFWTTISLLVVMAAIVLAIPEDLYPFAMFRQISGSSFVLWWPGFSFTKAFFPSYSQGRSLSFWERVVLSICVSLAIVSVIGLILNYTPWGVRLVPLVISILSLAIFFATVGVIREYSEAHL